MTSTVLGLIGLSPHMRGNLFAREFGDGRIYRAAIRRHDERRVRLTTLHRIKPRDAKKAAKRGDLLRDRRGWHEAAAE